MAAPNDGSGQYPPQQQYHDDGQYQTEQPGFEQQGSPPPSAGGAYQAPDQGKKKKRGYATQAFEYGAGGNSGPPPPGGLGSATPVGASYPGQNFQQGGYPSPTQGAPYGQQQQGMPPGQPAVGGYQAPDPYYNAGGAPTGMAGITSNMAGMNLGGGPQQPVQQQMPQQQQQQPRPTLNQLYPTDLLNQPFNVSELDLAPPACILPPNVSICLWLS